MRNSGYVPKRRAVVLLSGGLDSATTLYLAREKGFHPVCLIFDYGQRHIREMESAKKIACACGCAYKIIRISLPWKGSSLIDKKLKLPGSTKVPEHQSAGKIPNTYVPARNIIFLSFAISYAETIGAEAIFIGANAVDFSGYPDCRPQFYAAFNKMACVGTKTGVRNKPIRIIAPLIKKSKADIIRLGNKLAVPYELTWSCYKGARKPCGICDSCYYRSKGFREAGIKDPALKKLKT